MNTDTFLITGGTGRTGRRIATRLDAQGHERRIASRGGTPPFDWDVPDTWSPHLAGATAAYVCFSPDLAMPGADATIAAFTDAALAHGVRRLVLLSGRGEEGAQAAERLVLGSGLDATVVRCAWFAQNFSEHFLLGQVLRGRLTIPAGTVREPFVDLDDVADVATLALTTGRYAGEVLELTGPESLTFAEAASVLGDAIGRPVAFDSVGSEEFVAALRSDGVPAEDAEGLAWLVDTVLDGRNEATTDTIERVLGRPARRFADYARGAVAAGAWREIVRDASRGLPSRERVTSGIG